MPKQRMLVGKWYWWLLGVGMIMAALAIAWWQSRPIGQDIVFVSDRDGFSEIYVMNADGSRQTRLTHSSPFYHMAILVRRWYYPPALADYLRESREDKVWPVLSPDGRHIAFQCQRESRWHVCVMNADGSDLVYLSYEDYQLVNPTWAPDSKRIIFNSWQGWENQIFIASADGRHIGPLTSFKAGIDYNLAWSPDGQKIALSLRNTETGDLNIYLMNPDGSNVVQLTNGKVDTEAFWSPDGKQIAYISSAENGSSLFVINVDGTDLRLLTPDPDFYNSPVWSPNGKQIAFTCSQLDICVVNADGKNLINLTSDAPLDGLPNWSPDSQRIVFTRDVPVPVLSGYGYDREIFVINANGSNLTRLTNHPANDSEPVWRK